MGRNPECKGGPSTPVWFTGQERNVIVQAGVVDELGALVTLDIVHHKVHEGLSFQADHYNATLAAAGTIILSTPDPIGYECHFTVLGAAGGDCTIEVIEGATPTGGTNRVARSLNRNHPDGPNCLADPALAGGVVIAGPMLVPGGSDKKASGGSLGTRSHLEWVTDPTEAYAIRLTNISGEVIPASVVVNYYR